MMSSPISKHSRLEGHALGLKGRPPAGRRLRPCGTPLPLPNFRVFNQRCKTQHCNYDGEYVKISATLTEITTCPYEIWAWHRARTPCGFYCSKTFSLNY